VHWLLVLRMRVHAAMKVVDRQVVVGLVSGDGQTNGRATSAYCRSAALNVNVDRLRCLMARGVRNLYMHAHRRWSGATARPVTRRDGVDTEGSSRLDIARFRLRPFGSRSLDEAGPRPLPRPGVLRQSAMISLTRARCPLWLAAGPGWWPRAGPIQLDWPAI